jgi:hypothetical protein
VVKTSPTDARIKNPVGVGETYGVRREETLRVSITLEVKAGFQ